MSLFHSPPKRTTRAGVKPIVPGKKRATNKERSTMTNETLPIPSGGGNASNSAASDVQIVGSGEAREHINRSNSNTAPPMENPNEDLATNTWWDSTIGRGRGSRATTPSVGGMPRSTQTHDTGRAWSQVEARIDNRMEEIIQRLNDQRTTPVPDTGLERERNVADTIAQDNIDAAAPTIGNSNANQNFLSINRDQTDPEAENYRQYQIPNEPREFRGTLSNPSGAFASFPREYTRSNVNNVRAGNNRAYDEPYRVHSNSRTGPSVRMAEPYFDRQTADMYTERRRPRHDEVNSNVIKLLAFRISPQGEQLEDEWVLTDAEFREIKLF